MKRLLITLVFVVVLLLLPIILYKVGFFTLNNPISSNKLIIEGWLDSEALDEVPFNFNNYDTIFIVGIRKPAKWDKISELRNKKGLDKPGNKAKMPWEGFLFLKGYNQKKFNDTIKTIKVVANGTKGHGKYAHFLLLLKDSVIGHTFVNEQKDTFTFHVNLTPDKLDFLSIYFNNDYYSKTEDINLTIYEVSLDSTSFLPSKNELFFIPAHKYGLINSNAVNSGYYLSTFSNIKAKVITIDTLFTKRNNTLASARAFVNYITKNNITISSVNIYTLDSHSRRTNLAYRKTLGPKVKVGSITKSCPECIYGQKGGFWEFYYNCFDELVCWLVTLIQT